MGNMDIYEAGRKVPKEAQRPFDNGKFKGTDINPMWRIKKLTELFGPAGIGWYYEVLSERSEEHGDVTMAIVDLNLYVKLNGEWSKPIYGTGGNQLLRKTKNGSSASDEGYKMALTDALSVACKALGIGADVYFEKDKTKYTAESGESKDGQRPEPMPPVTFGGEPPQEQKPQKPPEQKKEEFICDRCKSVLKPYIGVNGKMVSVQSHVKRSCELYGGKIYCLACISDLKGAQEK